ncbi:VOC family protein [Neobacillus vireti]|uniref:VOC family protein n=1 Tax=Neobacillus vireti TaxID=220686 RepID=UPI002FFE2352
MYKNPHYFSHLAHVELISPKLEESANFFKNIIGLEESGRSGNSVYFRAWGEHYHHTLKITEGTEPGLGHIGWRADSPAALEEAAAHIEKLGQGIGWIEGDLGHGRAYQFTSPDGHLEEIFWDVELYEAPDPLQSKWKNRPQKNPGRGISPRRIDHITLFSNDVTKDREFYQNIGFRYNEGIFLNANEPGSPEIGAWLSVTNLSHDIAFLKNHSGKPGGFNHVCYAVESREEVLLAADHILESGYELAMGGPTRHALAEGFFFYVDEPGGNRFELYAGAHLVFAPDFGPYRWSLSENPNDAWGREMPWDASGKVIK